jgi:hypothetical protein
MSASRRGALCDEPHDSPSQVLHTASSGLPFGSSTVPSTHWTGHRGAFLAATQQHKQRGPTRNVIGPDLRRGSGGAGAERSTSRAVGGCVASDGVIRGSGATF